MTASSNRGRQPFDSWVTVGTQITDQITTWLATRTIVFGLDPGR
jgi:hypothetical protein